MYIYALENEKLSGAYNAVAPQPVTNKELIYAIARAQNKWFIPVNVPGFALRLMLGELSTEILKSANLSSKKMESEGFQFEFPNVQQAANELVKEKLITNTDFIIIDINKSAIVRDCGFVV